MEQGVSIDVSKACRRADCDNEVTDGDAAARTRPKAGTTMAIAQSHRNAWHTVDVFYLNRCDFGSPVSGWGSNCWQWSKILDKANAPILGRHLLQMRESSKALAWQTTRRANTSRANSARHRL